MIFGDIKTRMCEFICESPAGTDSVQQLLRILHPYYTFLNRIYEIE
jgi:hypothetical protein